MLDRAGAAVDCRMTDDAPTLWMVRSGPGGKWAAEAAERGVIAFGAEVDAAHCRDVNEVSGVLREHFRTWGDRRVKLGVAVWSAFLLEMQVGDVVTTFDRAAKGFRVGTVTGEVRAAEPPVGEGEAALLHERPVDWRAVVTKAQLSEAARAAVGDPLPIVRCPAEVAAEVRTLTTSAG